MLSSTTPTGQYAALAHLIATLHARDPERTEAVLARHLRPTRVRQPVQEYDEALDALVVEHLRCGEMTIADLYDALPHQPSAIVQALRRCSAAGRVEMREAVQDHRGLTGAIVGGVFWLAARLA
jgi:hypothetical protein